MRFRSSLRIASLLEGYPFSDGTQLNVKHEGAIGRDDVAHASLAVRETGL